MYNSSIFHHHLSKPIPHLPVQSVWRSWLRPPAGRFPSLRFRLANQGTKCTPFCVIAFCYAFIYSANIRIFTS